MLPRLLPLVLLLLAAPASAAQVRVKSKHPPARVAGAEAVSYKVGAEQVLRGATIGPSSVRVLLRRLAPASAGPIAVKLMRDGREVSRLLVGGEPVERIEGEAVLASAPVEKQFDVPAGPHTLFVEVGPGEGEVLVAFEEPRPSVPASLVKRTPKRRAPPPKTDPARQAVAAAGAEEAAAGPESPENQQSASAAGPKEPEADAAEPRAVASATDSMPGGLEQPARVGEPASRVPHLEAQAMPRARVPRRLFVGLRAGGVSQPQIAAFGLAAGLSARWALLAPSTKPATGPFVGLSADFLRYRASWSIPRSAQLPAHSHELSVTALPVLAEASWSFALGPVVPFVGGSLGLTFASVGSNSSVASASDSGALFSAGLHAGLELPFGADRLGLELRWLHANTGENQVASDLQVGGLLAQASWRFGI